MSSDQRRLSMRESVVQALASWRTASVSLLSFASGLPLGLVWIAIPDWMRSVGVDIRIVGLFTLAQAPWTFKMVWAPLMDRYSPPLLGRRRGWALIMQLVLSVLILMLAGVGKHPETPWVVAALVLAANPELSWQDVRDLLRDTADPIDPEDGDLEHCRDAGRVQPLFHAGSPEKERTCDVLRRQKTKSRRLFQACIVS